MYAPPPHQRIVSALASLSVVMGVGTALVLALASDLPIPRALQETLVSLTTEPEVSPPPPKVTPRPTQASKQAQKAASSRPKDEASPENLRNRATAVFAPVLAPIRQPPPIIAAPIPAAGNAGNTGASDRPGPGQGAGGVGNGTGGGGNGGSGGDGSDDAQTRPIQTKGKLYWSDLPRDLREAKRGGELELTYRVNVDGRVSNCRVIRSSGMPSLDAQTCRLITERFRFRPSRDSLNRPVPSNIIEIHGWDPEPEDVAD